MKINIWIFVICLFLSFLLSGHVFAAGSGELHKKNWNYFFGNHIDWHQESRLKKDGTLQGRLYILPIPGKFTDTGIQVYRHPRGPSKNEECGITTFECKVGWKFKAFPKSAEFLYHQGVNGDDHPIWMLNRKDIPQPSSVSHFHWIANLGPTGTSDNRPVNPECDKGNASKLETESPEATGKICEGWLLQLRSIRDFAFEHGGEIIIIRSGVDLSSHLNVVTNYSKVSADITPTR